MRHRAELIHPSVRADAELLARYLEILDVALARTDRPMAIAALVQGLRRDLAGRAVLVEMLRSDGGSVVACARFEHGRLVVVDAPLAATKRWVVWRDHVRDVVARPGPFLADPLRFELPFDLPAPRRPPSVRSPANSHP
jgi:hypothetical protein